MPGSLVERQAASLKTVERITEGGEGDHGVRLVWVSKQASVLGLSILRKSWQVAQSTNDATFPTHPLFDEAKNESKLTEGPARARCPLIPPFASPYSSRCARRSCHSRVSSAK